MGHVDTVSSREAKIILAGEARIILIGGLFSPAQIGVGE